MEKTNIVLCGLGGQGILFMTKVLARAAVSKGYDVMGAETHGMAQRGGSVTSHLRLGDVEGSLVRNGTAHFLLALDEQEAYRSLPFLAPGAHLYTNAAAQGFPRQEVRDFFRRRGIVAHAMPAAAIALALGAPMSANLALLGFFSSFGEGPFTREELRATIDRMSPARFREDNLKVFDEGAGRAEKAGGSSPVSG